MLESPLSYLSIRLISEAVGQNLQTVYSCAADRDYFLLYIHSICCYYYCPFEHIPGTHLSNRSNFVLLSISLLREQKEKS